MHDTPYRRRHTRRWALALALLAGCGGRAHLWDSALSVSGPHEVAGQALWVEGTRGRVLALDPRAAGLPVRAAAMPRNATHVLPSPTGNELLVLSAGEEAIYQGERAVDPALSVVRAGTGGAAPSVRQTYALAVAFDRLAVSSDGRHAVAYFSSAEGRAGVFRNPSQVALLDLGAAPGPNNPVLRTLRSSGSAPLGVFISPDLPLPPPAGTPRRLAVVLADNAVTLLDVRHPTRREVQIPLVKPSSSVTVRPEEVLFSSASGSLFVRAREATDLYALTLTARQAQAKDDNDFTVALNQPSAGKVVLDMVLFSDGGKDLLLTANASKDLAVIEAATSEFATISLGEPVDTIVPVPATRPTAALLYSAGAPTPRVHLLGLKGLYQSLEHNLQSRTLSLPVHQLVAAPDGRHALVVHNSARTVASILDLTGAQLGVAPIQGRLPLKSFDFVGSSHLVGAGSGGAELGILDLSSLLARTLRLDGDPLRVLAIGSAIVVTHSGADGSLTVVPGPAARREECRRLWGAFVDGLLDEPLED